ncbi:MAG: hypothetical protein II482_03575 [Lachnospiraceae bacterium]|nr:hypothetical protein [Lachnospiraceae bacterium]
MKKYLRILLPLMILVVFAAIGTSSTFASTAVGTNSGVTVSTTTVPVKTLSDSAISKPAYSQNLNAGYTQFIVYPVKATATGKMYIDLKAPDTNLDTVYIGLGKLSGTDFTYYSFSSCTPESPKTGEGCFDVVKGKTYYVGVKGYSRTPLDQAQVRAYIVPYTNNRVLKAQSKYLISSTVKGTSNSDYTKTALYYKVTPTKTGVMTVTLKSYGSSYGSSGSITLYSSGKKLRSEKLTYDSSSKAYKVRFGVKKGVTYYIKATDVYGTSSGCYKYGIKYSVAAATDRSLSKKSSAKTLVRKATSTPTLFTANGKTETDWYKFKVTSKRKTVVTVDASEMRGSSDQKLTITFYKGSTKVDSTVLYPGNSGKFTLTYGTTYGKANAGTYYVKVTKTAKLSGKYRIKYVI